MPAYTVHVELNSTGIVPADRCVNTWAIQANDLVSLDAALDSLLDFYEAIDGILSSTLSSAGGAHRIKAYDIADPEPRVPVRNNAITLSPAANTSPREVAIALSFQATPVSGVSPQRRKGRVFIGPLSLDVQDGTTARPNAGQINTIVTAADNFLTASLAAAGWAWCVWSRSDALLREVTSGWVDNEYDTIRARGRLATSRTEFP